MPEQSMKPETVAKKLGVLLSAMPQEFHERPVTRSEFLELQASPPAWLAELRRTGPHPRPGVAHKLGVSTSGLARGGVTEPLTTAEIKALLADPPEWLVAERTTQARVREEAQRVRFDKAAKEQLRREREV